MTEYDVAQICLNGYVANEMHINFPEFNKDFCEKCGKKPLLSVQSVKTNSRSLA
ncbi:MAG: DUF2321 domain-containing protein [Candidatus Brocadia sp.]